MENIPILFFVNEGNQFNFRNNLTEILKRNDIIHEQLFFYIEHDVNRSQAVRVIKDLGVISPQIIETPDDDAIKKFLEIYPRTAYVRHVIEVLRKTQTEINAVLQDENEQSVRKNKDIHDRIDELDEVIHKLKTAAERISERDNYERPEAIQSAIDACVDKIMDWRKRKIKITNENDAPNIAFEFDREVQRFFKEFINQIDFDFQTAVTGIRSNFASDYAAAEFNDGYTAALECQINLTVYEIPRIMQGLVDLKDERMIEHGDSLFGTLKNAFTGAAAQERELIKEVTFKYEEWRNYAKSQISTVINLHLMYQSCR
jgi:hypothetical protein